MHSFRVLTVYDTQLITLFHMSTSCLNTGLILTAHTHLKTIPYSWHVCVLSENVPQPNFGVSVSSIGDENTNDFKWPHK
jgi:hypothetical protein